MSLRLVYQDPMGTIFTDHHGAVATLAIGFIALILFLSARWLQRQLSGQELEIRSTRILNGERGRMSAVLLLIGQRTSSALMYCFPEIRSLLTNKRNARHPYSLLRRAGHQNRPGNRLFLITTTGDAAGRSGKVGAYGVVMMIRLPDFTFRATKPREAIRREEQIYAYFTLLIDILPARSSSPLARYHRSVLCCAVTASKSLKRSGKVFLSDNF